jgi:hypothetical protein
MVMGKKVGRGKWFHHIFEVIRNLPTSVDGWGFPKRTKSPAFSPTHFLYISLYINKLGVLRSVVGKMGKEKFNLCFLTLDTYVKKVFPVSPRFYSGCCKIPTMLKQQVYSRVGHFPVSFRNNSGTFKSTW